jgi:hypothetical protein
MGWLSHSPANSIAPQQLFIAAVGSRPAYIVGNLGTIISATHRLSLPLRRKQSARKAGRKAKEERRRVLQGEIVAAAHSLFGTEAVKAWLGKMDLKRLADRAADGESYRDASADEMLKPRQSWSSMLRRSSSPTSAPEIGIRSTNPRLGIVVRPMYASSTRPARTVYRSTSEVVQHFERTLDPMTNTDDDR